MITTIEGKVTAANQANHAIVDSIVAYKRVGSLLNGPVYIHVVLCACSAMHIHMMPRAIKKK